MPRPRGDGTPAKAPNKCKLTDMLVVSVKPDPERTTVWWDQKQAGLALAVQPTGHRAWKVVYHHGGRPRWYHLGNANAIGLADARRLANKVMLQVAEGADPQAERMALRGQGTFAELASRYRDQYAKRKNKSWKQADALVRRWLLPRWGKLQAQAITRADVRAALARITAPVLANQVLAAASAIFSWAVKQDIIVNNPCRGVERNPTRSRERVLSDSEIPLFWAEFSPALKMILLTGQRPGEVGHMRREHIMDNWWTMPGEPVPELGWPGTKNGRTHRVWLPVPAQALLAQFFDGSRHTGLDEAMRVICTKLGAERTTPHDLRRTFSSKVTALGFGRDAMNRVTNHKEGGIADVYDRHEYAEENKRVMEAVSRHILALAEGGPDNVVKGRFRASAKG
jgi:integrase